VSARFLAGVVAPVLCAGCPIVHLEHNAPGNIVVQQPPDDLRETEPQPPDDPGERYILLAAGGFAGGGGGLGDDDNTAMGAFGLESSLFFASAATSHPDDDPLIFLAHPRGAIGFNLGWTLLEIDGSERLGPGYLELQVHRLTSLLCGAVGAAAGYAWNPREQSHGPQVTIFWNMLYFRMTHLFGRGTDLLGGLVIKWRMAWVWSQ
jgi:hypothetical protein